MGSVLETPATDGRTRHYAAFYGLQALPTDRPLTIVHGNCQAESLRVLLDGGELAAVRIPPVHELGAPDLPHLARLLARARVLISQPVRSGYRGLPLGTDQLIAQCPTGVRVIRVPVIRFAGLYPTHAIVRPPSEPSAVPPLVPYHDLLTLAQAGGLLARGAGPPELEVATVRAIATASIAQLCAREQAHATVVVSDLFRRPAFEQMRTINHPGNPVSETLSRRICRTLGIADPPPSTRPLLAGVHAPRHPAVIAAFGLPDDPRPAWTVEGHVIEPAAVREAHLAWYAQHPDVVDAGLRRHRETLRRLLA